MENLIDFNKKTTIINKDLVMYEDLEKGVIFPLNTVHLLARVDYLELDKQELTIAKFQKKVEDLEYNKIEVERPVPKNEITKRDSDKFTITNKKVMVSQVWNVSNSAGAYKSFINKEDAIQLAKEINNKVLEGLK